MLLGSILLVASSIAGLTSAGTLFKPGIQFFEREKYMGRSKIIVPEDGKCTSMVPFEFDTVDGSMKMLSGGMECALYSTADCTDSKYNPKSRFRESPDDNTSKTLSLWLNYHGLYPGDLITMRGYTPVQAFLCRSFVNNLLQKDSSSKNKHIANDGWHEPGEPWGNL